MEAKRWCIPIARTGLSIKRSKELLLLALLRPRATSALPPLSDRSLRRQLREQGISFRGLLDELRMQIALKYLRTTRLANEDIALALGFSDAANFRRAFRRWTNKSSSAIRDEQVKSL